MELTAYYDVKLSGSVVTLSLNAAAKPENVLGTRTGEEEGEERQVPAFDTGVGEDGTEVGVGTLTISGLYYALQANASIREMAMPPDAI